MSYKWPRGPEHSRTLHPQTQGGPPGGIRPLPHGTSGPCLTGGHQAPASRGASGPCLMEGLRPLPHGGLRPPSGPPQAPLRPPSGPPQALGEAGNLGFLHSTHPLSGSGPVATGGTAPPRRIPPCAWPPLSLYHHRTPPRFPLAALARTARAGGQYRPRGRPFEVFRYSGPQMGLNEKRIN